MLATTSYTKHPTYHKQQERFSENGKLPRSVYAVVLSNNRQNKLRDLTRLSIFLRHHPEVQVQIFRRDRAFPSP